MQTIARRVVGSRPRRAGNRVEVDPDGEALDLARGDPFVDERVDELGRHRVDGGGAAADEPHQRADAGGARPGR